MGCVQSRGDSESKELSTRATNSEIEISKQAADDNTSSPKGQSQAGNEYDERFTKLEQRIEEMYEILKAFHTQFQNKTEPYNIQDILRDFRIEQASEFAKIEKKFDQISKDDPKKDVFEEIFDRFLSLKLESFEKQIKEDIQQNLKDLPSINQNISDLKTFSQKIQKDLENYNLANEDNRKNQQLMIQAQEDALKSILEAINSQFQDNQREIARNVNNTIRQTFNELTLKLEAQQKELINISKLTQDTSQLNETTKKSAATKSPIKPADDIPLTPTSNTRNNNEVMIFGKLNEDDITFDYLKEDSKLVLFEQGYSSNSILSMDEEKIKSEYKALHELQSKCSKPKFETIKETFALNRYSDIVPFKYNAINLDTKFSPNSYINASLCSSANLEKRFIVTQGPLDSSTEDFWGMCFSKEINLVLMLCKFRAGNRPQCSEYFPYKGGNDSFITNEKIYEISLDKEENLSDDLIKRIIIIKKLNNGSQKLMTHIQYTGWPDYGVPSLTTNDSLIQLLRILRKNFNETTNQIVIHCSAGVGRSGTILGLFNLIQIVNYNNKANDYERRISVFSVVRRMREERCFMVQTLEQYVLIYEILKKLIKKDIEFE